MLHDPGKGRVTFLALEEIDGISRQSFMEGISREGVRRHRRWAALLALARSAVWRWARVGFLMKTSIRLFQKLSNKSGQTI